MLVFYAEVRRRKSRLGGSKGGGRDTGLATTQVNLCLLANNLRSKAPFTEPTPNRGQRMLVFYAEVRRRKSRLGGSKGGGRDTGLATTQVNLCLLANNLRSKAPFTERGFGG